MTAILILILVSLIKTLGLIFVIILPMVSYTVYAERRVSALIQDRLGPNRVGIFGSASAHRGCREAVVEGGFYTSSR